MVAFFLLPEWLVGAVILGLPGGMVAATAAQSTSRRTYRPADITAGEKRRLRKVTSLLVIGASLATVACAFFVPPHLWWGSALLGSYLPSVKALLVFNGSFFLGTGFVLASGLIRLAGGQAG